MAEIRIESGGTGGEEELSELHAWLLEDNQTSGIELAAEGADDGSLGLVDTLIAGISTVSALVALYYTIRAFQSNRDLERPREKPSELEVVAPDGTRLVIRASSPEAEDRILRDFAARLGVEGAERIE